jgi:ribosomal protein L37AE/L43A
VAKTAQCPSCGAPVTFRTSVSILAVCEYCRTTLLNADGRIEDLGKMAELAQDRSRLQVGADGAYHGKRFEIVGRIQLQYAQGLWNEWFLLFSDGRTGWLSEAAGEYSLSFLRAFDDAVPPFSKQSPGSRLRIGRAEWTVTNIERATCVAGEGELPFKVGGGYPAPVVDLRPSQGGVLATLDYSEDESKPLLFIGEIVDFPSLDWRNLREDYLIPAEQRLRAKALLCKACGAALELRHEGIISIVCTHCGSVIDAETGELIQKLNYSNKSKPKSLIPIGRIGILRGKKLEVIGFMQSYMVSEGSRYYWREYLLSYVDSPGFRFLNEYDGHWSVVDVLQQSIPKSDPVRFQGHTFRHFQHYTGVVDYVIGEFTWRVKTGDKTQLDDFVAPPFLLSREKTDNEISWSLAEYVSPQEVITAFNVRLPEPVGVYANQPNPLRGKLLPLWKYFLLFAMLGTVFQIVLSLGSHSSDSLMFYGARMNIANKREQHLSDPFVLRNNSNLEMKVWSDWRKDGWVELGLALIRESDGAARYDSVELSSYSGYDWSEIELNRTLVFHKVPPGTWRLLLECVDSSPSLDDTSIFVYTNMKNKRPDYLNLFIYISVIILWPVMALLKYQSFESKRFAESDYS